MSPCSTRGPEQFNKAEEQNKTLNLGRDREGNREKCRANLKKIYEKKCLYEDDRGPKRRN